MTATVKSEVSMMPETPSLIAERTLPLNVTSCSGNVSRSCAHLKFISRQFLSLIPSKRRRCRAIVSHLPLSTMADTPSAKLGSSGIHENANEAMPKFAESRRSFLLINVCNWRLLRKLLHSDSESSGGSTKVPCMHEMQSRKKVRGNCGANRIVIRIRSWVLPKKTRSFGCFSVYPLGLMRL